MPLMASVHIWLECQSRFFAYSFITVLSTKGLQRIGQAPTASGMPPRKYTSLRLVSRQDSVGSSHSALKGHTLPTLLPIVTAVRFLWYRVRSALSGRHFAPPCAACACLVSHLWDRFWLFAPPLFSFWPPPAATGCSLSFAVARGC